MICVQRACFAKGPRQTLRSTCNSIYARCGGSKRCDTFGSPPTTECRSLVERFFRGCSQRARQTLLHPFRTFPGAVKIRKGSRHVPRRTTQFPCHEQTPSWERACLAMVLTLAWDPRIPEPWPTAVQDVSKMTAVCCEWSNGAPEPSHRCLRRCTFDTNES